MPWGGLLSLGIGAGVGLLESSQQAKAVAAQNKMQAAIAKWSPWTGMKAQPVAPVNSVAAMLPYAAAGGQFGMNYNLNNALAGRLNAGLFTGSDTSGAGTVGDMTGTGATALAANTPSFAANAPSSATLGAGGASAPLPTISSSINPFTGLPMTSSKWMTTPDQFNSWAAMGGNNNSSTGQ
jgi:hypothetical protein